MNFRKILLSDQEKIDACRRFAGHTASSHAFSSLYLWCEEKDYRIAFFGDAFLIQERNDYFFPCGKEEDAHALINAVLKDTPHAVFRYARACDKALAERLYGERVTALFDDTAREYLYNRTEQIAMVGKKFTYQRAKCNKARRLGEMVSKPLTQENLADAETILESWAAFRADRGDYTMTKRALTLLVPLSLIGNILYLNGDPIGFDLGCMITEDTLDNHIAKTLRDDVDALMKLLWYEALPDTVKTINREEDLGIRGLRIHKEDAQPSGYNDTYILTFQ